MKYLKRFNESFKDDKLDFILDKISAKGMDSLTDSERFFLDNIDDYEDYQKNLSDQLLFSVQKYLEENDLDSLNIDTKIQVEEDSKNNYKHYIESIDEDVALIVVYENDEIEVDDYHLPLEELSEEVKFHLLSLLK